MSAPLTRREILFSLTTAGVVGTAVGATAQQITNNPPEPDLPSQDERLGQVLRLMTNADRRLMNIQAGWQNPPDPDKPETIALLNSLIGECNSIMDIANALLLDIPRA